MDRWQGKVAVITGASSGIGAAVAESLVKQGLLVVGLARRAEKITENAEKLKNEKGKLFGLKADISKEEDVVAAFKWIKDEVGPVHILVNSAGVYRISSLSDGSTDTWKEVFDINVIGLCMTTREAIRDMELNKVDGHIVHINSKGGHKIVESTANVCGASKFAVTALTETLRQELVSKGSKIKVTSISPGVVLTDIFQNTFDANNEPIPDEFKNWIANRPALQCEDMANAVVYVLGTPPHVQVHELTIGAVGETF